MKIFLNVLKVLGIICLSLTCNSIPIVLLWVQNDLSTPIKWLLGITYVIFILAVIFFLWKKLSAHDKENLFKQPIKLKDFGFVVLYWLAARIIAAGGTVIITALTGASSTANDEALMSVATYFSGGFFFYTVLYCLLIGIFGPIIEEMAYRAFPTYLLFNGKLTWVTGVVTTAIFALPHATTILEFILYFGMGSAFYLAYRRRGNIKDSMLVHILNNISGAILFLLLPFV